MPIRRPGDHLTGFNRASGGMRQDIFSCRPITGGAGRWLAAAPALHPHQGEGDESPYAEHYRQPDEDPGDVDVREQGGGHQGAGEDEERPDDDGRHPVQPVGVDPRPEHFHVVAQQEQEHAGRGEQQAGQAWTLVVIRPRGAPGMSTIPAATATMAGS